ncbi:MAG TPA: Tex family protein [Oligoflexus sp.]|uniref:Tex family protein n=1 Tax=Oligoflexus sp. TaxID=1971216 RepID=UPI002D7F1A48|nr:Tex family protein [Oligoflexus sp.]HET9236023.1 Tex family protein [Oligoflexus sp.]
MVNLIGKISSELGLKEFQVHNSVKLMFDEECTIPFVARYRKEMTGSLDEVALRDIRERYNYLTELESNKQKYLKVVEEHCKKSPELMDKYPELKAKFEKCETKQELEDLYLPFKPKRRTRAQVAREKGLEPLLEKILAESAVLTNLLEAAKPFVTASDASIDPALKVPDEKAALAGAADIYAEQIAETAELRALVRHISQESGVLVSKKIEGAEAEDGVEKTAAASKDKKSKKTDPSKYQNYFDYQEPISKAASHRVMAVRRGEAEKVLKVSIDVDVAKITAELKSKVIADRRMTPEVKAWVEQIVEDAYRRLVSPSIETELRLQLKQTAETEAIRVFSENLENLLLLPPIPGKSVLGVDPGLRTGSKFAVVDETGKLLTHTTLLTDLGDKETNKTTRAKDEILRLVKEYNVHYVAVGNGTGSREIMRLIAAVLKENDLKDVKRLVVNEAGASVYSTMDIAREEFPDLDPTIRSAVSIARRLQDPLAELVKIDPRSIGVGQYQHDVNVTKLKTSLEEVVESCVNRVGVNLNTASYKLLSYVSGIGGTVAKNIVAKRDKDGRFASRKDLMNVSGLGPKVFQQAAGFLRVPESTNPLDNSAVHPEAYEIVEKIANDQGKGITEIVGNRTLVETIPLEKYVTERYGMPTLKDIAKELLKPGRDPREDGARLMYSDDVSEIEDLKVGMTLPGTVTNVTNFGAFVDIGVHQDGLIHISELADQFVDDPSKVVSVGDVVDVRVIEVDLQRRRIGLSRRLNAAPKAQGAAARPEAVAAGQQQAQRPQQGGKGSPMKPRGSEPAARSVGGISAKGKAPQPNYTMDDLLAKFNQRK